MELEEKKKIVKLLLDHKILVSSDILNMIKLINSASQFQDFIINKEPNQDNINSLMKLFIDSNPPLTPNSDIISPNLGGFSTSDIDQNIVGNVNIKFSYKEEPKKREIQDFVKFFISRYNAIKKILMSRKELISPTSISRILQKNEKEEVSLIGIISDKQLTKNGNIILSIEDTTGEIKVIVTKNKPEVLEFGKGLVLDEVIGVVGQCSNDVIFANNLISPDIPLSKELKKAPEEVYSVFIGDMHFGSNVFLNDDFNKFIDWLSGRYGNKDQRDIAKKVRYL